MRIETVRGDITAERVDAIVNAANEGLRRGGGVCGAIFAAAGPELDAACAAIGGCATGAAVVTPGFALTAPWIVHTVGPVWHGGDRGEPELLAACYRRSVEVANTVGATSIAFPAISTGIFGYPPRAAAEIAIATLARIEEAGSVTLVHLVAFDETTRRDYQEILDAREPQTPGDYRATWDTIERLWAQAVARARRLPKPALYERVDGEWSFVETLRHLVFATDVWVSRTVLDEEMPYYRFGRAHSSFPVADAVAIGIDPDATPSFAEVMAVRADRMAVVRGIVDGLTDAELERRCARTPGPGYPDESRTVGDCLRVVMEEERAHYGYAVRDLAALEARS